MNWITKYEIKIRVEYDFITIKNTLGFVLKRVEFKNANKISFYLENEFLNDFVSNECLPEEKLVKMIEEILINEYENIFKKAKQMNFVLNIQVLEYDDGRDEINFTYIKEGKKEFKRVVIEKGLVKKYIEDFKKNLKLILYKK